MRFLKESPTNPHVSWQAACTVIGLLLLGGITVVGFGVFTDPKEPNKDFWVVMLSVGAFFAIVPLTAALWSRMSSAKAPGQRADIMRRIANGISVMVGAGVLTVLSRRYFTFAMMDQRWYILPTGLYLAGMMMIVNAMNPDRE